jgi:hypothetical protein
MFCIIALPNAIINSDRWKGDIVAHSPLSSAFFAAYTAKSISSFYPSATLQNSLPVDGSITPNVLFETLSTHFPLMQSFVLIL